MDSKLLYKYLENSATEEEVQQVLDWLDADPAHWRELEQVDKTFAASILHGAGIQPQSTAAEASHGARRRRRMIRYTIEAAAVVAIGFALSYQLTENRLGKWSQQTTMLEVPTGHYMSATLPDGTTVWLNSGTTLEYPQVFAGHERRVKVSGEAMFDVRHDARHPFVVETYACDIEALGTKFDVVADPCEGLFSTALLEGSVRVTNRLTPGEQLILKPNEEVFMADGRLTLDTIGSLDEYLWTEGMISFKGVSFEELMQKFERSFGVKIVIDRKQMPTINFNHGKVRISDGVDSALRLLQMASDFKYQREDKEGIIIIR